jgi:hypothetical protein
MLSAARVKGGGAFGTRVVCGQVFVDRKLMSARAAQDRFPIEFRSRPNTRLVAGDLSVTVEARVPTPTAFELDRDNVQRRVPMAAPRLRIDLDSVHLASVNNSHE